MKSDVRIFLAVVLGLELALVLVGSLPVTAERLADFDLTGDCPGRVGDVAALIAAIDSVNNNGQADTITLAPGCKYTLIEAHHGTAPAATGLPAFGSAITINGQGSTIQRANDAATTFRILRVGSSGTLHLKDLTIRNGEATMGGGIYNAGNLELTRCTVDGNLGHNGESGGSSWGDGGGIWSNWHLTMTQSIVSNNMAHSVTASGGGLSLQGTGRIENSTFTGNSVTPATNGEGGAIRVLGDLTLINCTVADNDADSGGGISIGWDDSLTMYNTIVANNSPENCKVSNIPVVDMGGNIQFGGVPTDSCGATITVLDPELDVLADNGGRTKTMALKEGSPAIDHVGCSWAPEIDQRGVPRPQGFQCDSGAYEAEPVLAMTKLSSKSEYDLGDVITYTIIVANDGVGWATNATVSDPLPTGQTFLGPITLEPPGSGTPGANPPILAQGLTLTPGELVTITFQVTVIGGPAITNVVYLTSTETMVPHTGTVTMNRHNELPVTADDTYTTTAGTPLLVPAPGVLDNDTDADNDPLEAHLETDRVSGTLELELDGSFVYTPAVGFLGKNAFTYFASDGIAVSEVATVTVTVVPYQVFLPVVLRK